MKRLFRLLVLCLLWTSLAMAQTAVVRRNVYLRSDASTGSDKLERLKPGDQVQLVEPNQTDGFYHVTAPDGQDGWVWGHNVEILASGPSSDHAPPSSGDLFSQLMSARKPATGQPLIENGSEVCGSTGDARNATLKRLTTTRTELMCLATRITSTSVGMT